MSEIRVLLCCGAGFSSGLLAQQGRKAAKKSGISMTIEARSESQVNGYLGQIDVLLLGPHYANQLENFKTMCAAYPIAVGVIPQDIYGQLDGKRLVELAQNMFQTE